MDLRHFCQVEVGGVTLVRCLLDLPRLPGAHPPRRRLVEAGVCTGATGPTLISGHRSEGQGETFHERSQ